MAAAKTPARSALMRSGDGRSGYPIAVGGPAKMYALSGVMRSGASRSNYHSGLAFITIGGVQVGTARTGPGRILWESLVLTDGLDATPTTGRATAIGMVPVAGQEVIITLGSKNSLEREFGGTILRTAHGALTSDPQKDAWGLSLIDFTWGLDTKLVSGYYTGSASTIAAALVATFAPGYTTAIAPGLPVLTGGITFTNQELTDCLSQLAKRIGSNWTCDYHRVVTMPAAKATDTPPAVLNAVHPSLRDFTHDRDLSQTVNRVYVEGGGVVAAATVPLGETILPLEGDPTWYNPAGGTVVSGPQRVTYTGVSASAGGGLVGPGAAPTGMPTLALAPGAGLGLGAYRYAVTFTTASGESIPGAIATITTAVLPGPATAPTAGTPTAGTGPNPGLHEYALTYVTAAGETTPGPRVSASTSATPPPIVAPKATATPGASGPDPGPHDYAVTFTTAAGETTPGPIGASATTGLVVPPGAAPVLLEQPCAPTGGMLWRPGDTVSYAVTFKSAAGETTAGPVVSLVARNCGGTPPFAPPIALTGIPEAPPGNTTCLYRAVNGTLIYRAEEFPPGVTTFLDDCNPIPGTPATPPATNTNSQQVIAVDGLELGGAGVTGRKLYRRSGGAGLRLLATIANNTATSYTDTTPNASLGAAPPASSTAVTLRIPLSALPVAPSPLVTGRRLYGTAAGGGTLRWIADLNLTVTTYLVITPDAGLGAAAPAANAANASQVALSSIPLGAPAVTARKLYRSTVGTTPLKLLATIANNTATTYLDAVPDASLGAAPPGADTSGLTQPPGNVLVGATSIVVANIGPFPPAGWAVIGNGTQVIRYTGVSGNTITGIPPTGPGSIQASIAYNSTITSAPVLTGIPASGVGAIRYPILKGSEVNLWVMAEDVAAQLARAALLGGDGVQEDYLQDRRLALAEATARATAILTLKRDPVQTIRYTSRDLNTRAGRLVTVNLGPPYNLLGVALLIQSVTETFTPTRTRLMPLYAVEASSLRWTFDQLLAMTRA